LTEMLIMASASAPTSAPPPAPGVDARQLVEVIRREHGDADENRLTELVVAYLRDHAEVLAVLARRLVHSALTAQRRADRRPADRDRDREDARAVARQIKVAIVLDMLCPNGKRLRFCTGAEVGAFGRAFTRIAAHVGDDQFVGEVLIESEAQQLLRAGARSCLRPSL
jgi:hypothetical protein